MIIKEKNRNFHHEIFFTLGPVNSYSNYRRASFQAKCTGVNKYCSVHLNLRSYVFHTNQWIFFHSRKSYIYSRRLQCRLVLFIPNVSYIEIWRRQTFSSIRHWTSSKLEILEYPRFLPAKAKLFPWVEISCTISLIFKGLSISARLICAYSQCYRALSHSKSNFEKLNKRFSLLFIVLCFHLSFSTILRHNVASVMYKPNWILISEKQICTMHADRISIYSWPYCILTRFVTNSAMIVVRTLDNFAFARKDNLVF